MEHHIDDHISAYIDNELHPTDRVMVEKHLQGCERCNQLAEELLNLQSEVIHSFQAIVIPEGLENRVWERIQFKTANKLGFVTFVITMVFLSALFLAFGSIIFKLVSIFFKVVFELIYAALHFIGSQPLFMLGFILFAILLFGISSISLRRLLRA